MYTIKFNEINVMASDSLTATYNVIIKKCPHGGEGSKQFLLFMIGWPYDLECGKSCQQYTALQMHTEPLDFKAWTYQLLFMNTWNFWIKNYFRANPFEFLRGGRTGD